MRQLTKYILFGLLFTISKLPMRQLTGGNFSQSWGDLSKLPMRQLTVEFLNDESATVSKLPMRQLTCPKHDHTIH